MTATTETGEALVNSRAEIYYSIVKKVTPKNEFVVRRDIVRSVIDWVDKNIEKLKQEDSWLKDHSTDFLYSTTWLKNHMPEIEQCAARDGFAFMVQPFKGCQLTRRVRDISKCLRERQKHTQTRMQRHNTLAEELQGNTRYKALQAELFPDMMLPPPQK